MITPLIVKLQNCQDKSELQSIYKDILSEYNNLNFPNQNAKILSLRLLTETVDTYIEEFDSSFLRSKNIRSLESLKIFDKV